MEIETTKLTSLFIQVLFGIIILPLGFIWAVNTIFQS